MDNKFVEQRSHLLRKMAETADPFTRERLVNLAERYEDCLPAMSKALKRVNAVLEGR
jgi:hypothetical protein